MSAIYISLVTCLSIALCASLVLPLVGPSTWFPSNPDPLPTHITEALNHRVSPLSLFLFRGLYTAFCVYITSYFFFDVENFQLFFNLAYIFQTLYFGVVTVASAGFYLSGTITGSPLLTRCLSHWCIINITLSFFVTVVYWCMLELDDGYDVLVHVSTHGINAFACTLEFLLNHVTVRPGDFVDVLAVLCGYGIFGVVDTHKNGRALYWFLELHSWEVLGWLSALFIQVAGLFVFVWAFGRWKLPQSENLEPDETQQLNC